MIRMHDRMSFYYLFMHFAMDGSPTRPSFEKSFFCILYFKNIDETSLEVISIAVLALIGIFYSVTLQVSVIIS